ncbi:sigma-70 family RNA polymerase sigma factor [Amycolatopsis sp. NPDC058340]|uniref:sigma-70 family RNA polymerase sigma factor n=1 Tax=Amycolatopsis sp. NPDC058340 TaxID=3346453 RepID=UPI0036571BE4
MDRAIVERALEECLPDMRDACRRILDNDRDAEDAAQTAVENALKRPPGKEIKNLRAWLCRVAINSAKDLARTRKARREVLEEGNQANTDPHADFRRSVPLRLDTTRLLDRIWNFLDKPAQENAALYLEVTFGHRKEAELAERLGVRLSEVRNRRWRGRRALGEAAAAAVLVTDPGEGANRCLIPFGLADGKEDSPELLDKVRTHVKACEKCRKRRDDRKGLMRFVLAVPGLAFAGDLLHRLLPTAKHKVAAASFVALVAVTAPYVPIPGWNDASPPSPATTAPMSRAQGPSTRIPSVAPPVVPPVAPPSPTIAPAPTTANAVPTTGAPPATGVAAPQAALSVTDSWVQYRRIAAASDGTCRNEPTSSEVRVTVAPGAESASIIVSLPGARFSLAMQGTDGGTRWSGTVGPVPNEDARTSLGITVEVVGANGARASRDLGRVDVFPC